MLVEALFFYEKIFFSLSLHENFTERCEHSFLCKKGWRATLPDVFALPSILNCGRVSIWQLWDRMEAVKVR